MVIMVVGRRNQMMVSLSVLFTSRPSALKSRRHHVSTLIVTFSLRPSRHSSTSTELELMLWLGGASCSIFVNRCDSPPLLRFGSSRVNPAARQAAGMPCESSLGNSRCFQRTAGEGIPTQISVFVLPSVCRDLTGQRMSVLKTCDGIECLPSGGSSKQGIARIASA